MIKNIFVIGLIGGIVSFILLFVMCALKISSIYSKMEGRKNRESYR